MCLKWIAHEAPLSGVSCTLSNTYHSVICLIYCASLQFYFIDSEHLVVCEIGITTMIWFPDYHVLTLFLICFVVVLFCLSTVVTRFFHFRGHTLFIHYLAVALFCFYCVVTLFKHPPIEVQRTTNARLRLNYFVSEHVTHDAVGAHRLVYFHVGVIYSNLRINVVVGILLIFCYLLHPLYNRLSYFAIKIDLLSLSIYYRCRKVRYTHIYLIHCNCSVPFTAFVHFCIGKFGVLALVIALIHVLWTRCSHPCAAYEFSAHGNSNWGTFTNG